MMRTEDDLRAAFRTLERHAPDADAVLRAVRDHSRGAAPSRRTTRPRAVSARRPLLRPLHLALAVGAAAAVTAAAVTVTLAGGRSGSGPDPVPSLRVHLLAAIDAARGDILYTGTPSDKGGTWVSSWYPRPGQRVRVRVLGYNVRGIPAKDAEYIFTFPAGRGADGGYDSPIDWGALHVSGTVIEVDHAERTWGEWHHTGIYLALPVSPAGIRSEIADGRLRFIARTTLRGRPAIELGMSLRQSGNAAVRVTTARLWVSASTYLPMRQLLTFSNGQRDTADYTFLQPTPANLARLHLVIPAGYQRTSYPGQGDKNRK